MRKNTNEDGLPIEMDVSKLAMGDVIDIFPYDGACKRHGTDEVLAEFTLKTTVLLGSWTQELFTLRTTLHCCSGTLHLTPLL